MNNFKRKGFVMIKIQESEKIDYKISGIIFAYLLKNIN
jgi:hypothetical protein